MLFQQQNNKMNLIKLLRSEPMPVVVRNEDDKRRYCNPSRTDVVITDCEFWDCEYSEICKHQKDKSMSIADGYKRLANVIDNARRCGGM